MLTTHFSPGPENGSPLCHISTAPSSKRTLTLTPSISIRTMVKLTRTALHQGDLSATEIDTPRTSRLSNRECHELPWDSIFNNHTWLDHVVQILDANPTLIGKRLNPALGYMVLVSGDISGDVTYYTKDLFFSSLKPHTYVEGSAEIMFDSGITLNIADILYCPELIPVNVEKLLCDGGKLCSTYLLWRDVDCGLKAPEPSSLVLTKSRIPGDDTCFWIIKLECEAKSSHFEVPLEDSMKDRALTSFPGLRDAPCSETNDS